MSKIITVGMFLALAFVVSAGSAAAAEEVKPWEDLGQFRGGASESAQDMGWERAEFKRWREQAQTAHREERLQAREQRLEGAVERGCLDPEELKDRLTQRRNRFR